MNFLILLMMTSISQEADTYFEAKNFEKAIENYKNIADEPTLQPWQKAVIEYNIAVSQIDLGQWNEALTTLQHIQTSSPYVLMHIEATKAYIHLHLAQYQGKKNDPVTLHWLRDALSEVNKASQSYCRLQNLEGDQQCAPSEELEALRHQIENQWSQFSNESLKPIDSPETAIYMEEALHWLQRAARLTNEDHDPMKTLAYAIEDQEYALSINRQYIQIKKPSEEMRQRIQKAQNEVLKTAEPFYGQVLEKEKKDYPEHCQCHPWNAVIPSFEEGYRRARWLLPIIDVQQDILRYWKQTQENVTKQEETPVKSEEAPASIKEVFSEIEQMDQDDRMPQKKIPVKIEGTKPW